MSNAAAGAGGPGNNVARLAVPGNNVARLAAPINPFVFWSWWRCLF